MLFYIKCTIYNFYFAFRNKVNSPFTIDGSQFTIDALRKIPSSKCRNHTLYNYQTDDIFKKYLKHLNNH